MRENAIVVCGSCSSAGHRSWFITAAGMKCIAFADCSRSSVRHLTVRVCPGAEIWAKYSSGVLPAERLALGSPRGRSWLLVRSSSFSQRRLLVMDSWYTLSVAEVETCVSQLERLINRSQPVGVSNVSIASNRSNLEIMTALRV